MASGSSLTVNSVGESLRNGEIIHYLTFRFSVGHKHWHLQGIHNQIEEKGWQKLPNLENSFVWFGENPPEVIDILKKASYDNHVCRYMTGRLTDIGLLEGTGTAPAVSEGKSGQQVAVPSSTLFNYGFSKATTESQIVKTLPELEQVKPVMDEGESD